jgi:hypothetical protein
MCWGLRVDLGGSPTRAVHVRRDGFKLRHRVGSVTDSGGRVALVLTKCVGSMEFAPTDFRLLQCSACSVGALARPPQHFANLCLEQ